MNNKRDHDGKSKAASAVDSARYPDPTDDAADAKSESKPVSPKNSIADHEKDASAKSRSLTDQVQKQSGSVQK